jgi:hypothetical protein
MTSPDQYTAAIVVHKSDTKLTALTGPTCQSRFSGFTVTHLLRLLKTGIRKNPALHTARTLLTHYPTIEYNGYQDMICRREERLAYQPRFDKLLTIKKLSDLYYI